MAENADQRRRDRQLRNIQEIAARQLAALLKQLPSGRMITVPELRIMNRRIQTLAARCERATRLAARPSRS
jgi:hypothetical protein